MANDILNCQIEALSQDLNRIDALLQNGGIKTEYRNPIVGKFGWHISTCTDDLDALKKSLASGLGAVDAWKEYARVRAEAQKVFDQCLDWLGGVALRDKGLEQGICSVAEELVLYYAKQTGVSWTSVMILGDERPFDDVALHTQMLRLQFPKWDIWNLPLITYEYGQLVARDDSMKALTTFEVDEKRRVEKLIKDRELDPPDLVLATEIADLRQRYQADPNTPVDEFLDQVQLHIRGLFADAFATYVLGPAYVYVQLFLRVIPTHVLRGDPNKCSFARRFAFMLRTLQEISNAEKSSEFDPGPYDGEVQRLTHYWRDSAPGMQAGYDGALAFGKPYDDWCAEIYAKLRRSFLRLRFRGDDWKQAKELGPKLIEAASPGGAAPVNASPPVILNAAWWCRIQNPGRIADIEKAVLGLLAAPRGGPAPGGGAAPQRT